MSNQVKATSGAQTRPLNEEASRQNHPPTRQQISQKAQPDGIACLLSFAKNYLRSYIIAVVYAIIGVAGQLVPYIAAAGMIVAVLQGQHDWHVYGTWVLVAFLGFMIKIVFHNLSTATSHKATFAVISQIRRALAQKLQRVPLG